MTPFFWHCLDRYTYLQLKPINIQGSADGCESAASAVFTMIRSSAASARSTVGSWAGRGMVAKTEELVPVHTMVETVHAWNQMYLIKYFNGGLAWSAHPGQQEWFHLQGHCNHHEFEEDRRVFELVLPPELWFQPIASPAEVNCWILITLYR